MWPHREQRTLLTPAVPSRRSHSWWRHQMETFFALLAICAGNSPAPGEFPAQRPVTRSFDVFFDLHLNKRLSKQSWGWRFETLSRPLWRHRNVSRIPGPYFGFITVGERTVALKIIARCSITQTPTGQSKVWRWHAWKMVVIYFKRI